MLRGEMSWGESVRGEMSGGGDVQGGDVLHPSILICDCLLPIDFEIVLVTFKLQDSIAVLVSIVQQ